MWEVNYQWRLLSSNPASFWFVFYLLKIIFRGSVIFVFNFPQKCQLILLKPAIKICNKPMSHRNGYTSNEYMSTPLSFFYLIRYNTNIILIIKLTCWVIQYLKTHFTKCYNIPFWPNSAEKLINPFHMYKEETESAFLLWGKDLSRHM